MKKKSRIEIERKIVSRVKREMDQPRLTESVRNGFSDQAALTACFDGLMQTPADISLLVLDYPKKDDVAIESECVTAKRGGMHRGLTTLVRAQIRDRMATKRMSNLLAKWHRHFVHLSKNPA